MILRFDLGKKGLTENFLKNIKIAFNNSDTIKIKVLKSYSADKSEIKQIAEKIEDFLEKHRKKHFISRVIGHTIVLRKLRKKKIADKS